MTFHTIHSKPTHDSLENCKGGTSGKFRLEESTTLFTLKRQTFFPICQPLMVHKKYVIRTLRVGMAQILYIDEPRWNGNQMKSIPVVAL